MSSSGSHSPSVGGRPPHLKTARQPAHIPIGILKGQRAKQRERDAKARELSRQMGMKVGQPKGKPSERRRGMQGGGKSAFWQDRSSIDDDRFSNGVLRIGGGKRAKKRR